MTVRRQDSFSGCVFAVLVLLALLLSGCGGSSGGGSGITSIGLPADAVTISADNATVIANSAVSSYDSLQLGTTLLKNEAALSAEDRLRLVLDRALDDIRSSSALAGRTETTACETGSYTATFEETATTAVGKIVFNECSTFGLTIGGEFNFNNSFDENEGPYRFEFGGELVYSFDSLTFTLRFDVTETGNETTESYSVSPRFSVSGMSGGGYLVTTASPIRGNYASFEVTSGTLMVEGANNTRLRIMVTAPNVAEIELDDGSGEFVLHDSIFL